MKSGLPFSIIVVEDDADDRFILDAAFLEIGYNAAVKKFIDGKAMFKYLVEIEPDPYLFPSLIVLNDTLPFIGTEGILQNLKANPLFQNILVVILSTGISNAKEQQLHSLGAYKCFEKGSTMQEIVDLVKELKNISQLTASNTGEEL